MRQRSDGARRAVLVAAAPNKVGLCVLTQFTSYFFLDKDGGDVGAGSERQNETFGRVLVVVGGVGPNEITVGEQRGNPLQHVSILDFFVRVYRTKFIIVGSAAKYRVPLFCLNAFKRVAAPAPISLDAVVIRRQ